MITVPTAELVGLLSDVVWCALDAAELPDLSSVRLDWDGELLHAAAQDSARVAWARWHPDDVGDPDGAQEVLGAEWGGTDDPWTIMLAGVDVRDLIRVFKLPRRLGRSPVHVTVDAGRLTVTRRRDTGLAELTVDVAGAAVDEPWTARDLLAGHDEAVSHHTIAFHAAGLADFARVRPRGDLELTFTRRRVVLVRIGDRFSGAVMATERESR